MRMVLLLSLSLLSTRPPKRKADQGANPARPGKSACRRQYAAPVRFNRIVRNLWGGGKQIAHGEVDAHLPRPGSATRNSGLPYLTTTLGIATLHHRSIPLDLI